MPGYDSREETCRYVWSSCRELLSDFEHQVRAHVEALGSARTGEREPFNGRYPAWWKPTDPELAAALADWEGFRWQTCQRVLAQHGDDLLNRCPRCRAVRRTPRARLCLWCLHDERTTPAPHKKGPAAPASPFLEPEGS